MGLCTFTAKHCCRSVETAALPIKQLTQPHKALLALLIVGYLVAKPLLTFPIKALGLPHSLAHVTMSHQLPTSTRGGSSFIPILIVNTIPNSLTFPKVDEFSLICTLSLSNYIYLHASPIIAFVRCWMESFEPRRTEPHFLMMDGHPAVGVEVLKRKTFEKNSWTWRAKNAPIGTWFCRVKH